MTGSLLVAEVFGPTVQGEGRSLGQRASFIRLGACNLSCSWCDTPYTWDRTRFDLRTELTSRPANELVTEVLRHDTPVVVITGGEPLLQQQRPGFRPIVAALTAAGRAVEVETNGTIGPADWLGDWPGVSFNVSPKLGHAGDPLDTRNRSDELAQLRALALAGRADFKFVAQTVNDVAEVAALVDEHRLPPSRVWVMPEGTTGARITAAGALADATIAAGFNVTTRLHVLAWGDERKR